MESGNRGERPALINKISLCSPLTLDSWNEILRKLVVWFINSIFPSQCDECGVLLFMSFFYLFFFFKLSFYVTVASEFESKWKGFSRKLPRKKENDNGEKQVKDSSLRLLQHRQVALNGVEGSFDCSNLEINWHLNLFWFGDSMVTALNSFSLKLWLAKQG